MAFLPQQFSVFPRRAAPQEVSLRFVSRYLPTTTLGGDFFHILPISETEAGVFICDVMGHGVRAALVTAIARALAEELEEFAADPGAFAWRPAPYEYEHDKEPIDILSGSPALRTAIDAGVRAEELARTWAIESQPFEKLREQYLVYT